MSVADICIIIILNIYQVHGQACTWTWLQPSGSDLTWTKSVGAVATFTASVNDILSNGDLLTWKMNFTELSVEQYDETANSFNSFLEDPRGVRTSFETPSDGRGHIYTMRFPTVTGVTLDLQNYEFTVTSQGCVSGATSTSVRLLVSNCDLNAFSSEANATDMTDCGYNCTREFTCLNDPSLSFQATCQADATWNETTPTSQDRCKFCNANDLGPSVTEATSAQAGVDQTKKFNCACPTGVESFVAECQTGLVWNYTATTIPCHAACDASEVTFASPGSDSFLCGVQRFTCNSHRVCEPTFFDLECAANGTWLSIDENECSKEMCSQIAVAEICGENCRYQNVSGISCGDTLVYSCANGTGPTVSLSIICNASGSFNYSGSLCQLNDTSVQDSCQEFCNLTTIEAICGENCQYGNLSRVNCNDTLSFNCTNGALSITSQPITCIGTYFNYSTSLCELAATTSPTSPGPTSPGPTSPGPTSRSPTSCSGGCNVTAIQSICGDSCHFESTTSLECNETLSYNCIDGAIPVTSQPVKCIDMNIFNYSASLCKPNITQSNASCSDVCSVASIQAICNGSCSYGDINEVACNDVLDYSCGRCEGSLPVVRCIGKDVFNQTELLCNNRGECCDESCIKKKIAMGLAATFSLEIIALAAYLGYLHQSVYHVFKTWLPWIVLMPILTATAVADWILIGISETENTIPPNATLTIGVVLTVVTTALLLVALAAHCRFKKSNKTKIGSSDGVTQNNGKVMSDAANSDR